MSPTIKADALAAMVTIGPVLVGATVAEKTRAATESLGAVPSNGLGLLALIITVAVVFDYLSTAYMPRLAVLEAEARNGTPE